MLINFSVQNWMSFKNKVTFSMVAGREKQHSERLPVLDNYDAKILPVATIFGSNASGKSSFIKAIKFVKEFIVKGSQPNESIQIQPFLLSSKTNDETSFEFEFLVEDKIFNYSFSATYKIITKEKLIQINTSSKKILFDRSYQAPDPKFHNSFKDHEFLMYVFKGTRDNMLFLTNSIIQNVDVFKPIYKWFYEYLNIITPDTKFGRFDIIINGEHKLHELMNDLLPQLDTGIVRLCGDQISINEIPKYFVARLESELPEGKTILFIADEAGDERITVSKKNGKLVAKKLVTWHLNDANEEVKFDIHQESDGTKRIIDILPAFISATYPKSKEIYIIDEVDRSLHPALTRELLEFYLYYCSRDTRAQMIFTSHDMQLMDQSLLRRDEIYVTDKNRQGVSSIINYGDFKDVRNDKDIRKSYLEGRIGGVPNITIIGDNNLL